MLASLLHIASALMSPEAQAQNFIHQWEQEESQYYRVQTFIQAPRILRFYSQENLDARVVEFTMGLLMECSKVSEYRSRHLVECDITKAQLGGRAFDGEQDKLNNIFLEYVALLDQAEVEMEITQQGRVKSLDLENVEKTTSRENLVQETLRMLVQRALAPMEIELPKSGKVPALNDSWVQRGMPLVTRLPTPYGTAGGVKVRHELTERSDADILTINTSGSGVVIPGSGQSSTGAQSGSAAGVSVDMDSFSSTSPNTSVLLSVIGSSQFDLQSGSLLRSESTVQGSLTASSSGVGSGLYINQYTLFERLDALPDGAEAALSPESAEGGEDSPAELPPGEVGELQEEAASGEDASPKGAERSEAS